MSNNKGIILQLYSSNAIKKRISFAENALPPLVGVSPLVGCRNFGTATDQLVIIAVYQTVQPPSTFMLSPVT